MSRASIQAGSWDSQRGSCLDWGGGGYSESQDEKHEAPNQRQMVANLQVGQSPVGHCSAIGCALG